MSKTELQIRRAQAEDRDQIVALVSEVLAEYGLTFGVGSKSDEELLHLPGSYRDNGGEFWVAVDPDGHVVGTSGVFPIDASTLELRKMYLGPSIRGRGLASRLFERVLTFARECGFRRIVLDTTDQMTDAIAFYEKKGFVRDDSQIRGARCTRGYALDL